MKYQTFQKIIAINICVYLIFSGIQISFNTIIDDWVPLIAVSEQLVYVCIKLLIN